MSVRDQRDVLEEVVVSIRNADVLSVAVRGVTRETVTGSLTGSDEIDLEKGNVKNVKTVLIGGVGTSDYTVNYKTGVITLNNAVTDNYSVTYDFGPDKIFSGYPRSDLTINSFPRIAVEYVDIQSNVGGFGNVNVNKHDISVVVYDADKENIREVMFNIRTWAVNNQNTLKYLRLLKPVMTGPIMIAGEFNKFKDKVMKQNFDVAGLLDYEVNN